MIGLTDIGKLISNPEAAASVSPNELKDALHKFEYCSTLHLLYLKSLSKHEDIGFEDALRFSAAHIIDREKMYFLIHSENKNTDEPVLEQIDDQISEKYNRSKLLEEIAEPTEAVVDSNVASEIASSLSEVNEKTTEEEPKEIKSHEEIIEQVHEEINEENNLNEILKSAPDLVEIVYELDLSEEIIPEPKEKISSIKEETPVDISATEKTEPEVSKENNSQEETLDTINLSEEVQEIDPSKLSFVEWLKYKKGLKSITEPIENKSSSETEKTVENEIKVTENVLEIKKPSISKSKVDELLNKFIKEEPSISKPKTAFFSPTKKAKESLEESPDLVTETLAKIYVLQKNYAKAIQAYEQLSLVYPEKKVFFATQIKKIKDLQQK